MRKTWRILRAMFPGLFTYGCAPHGFNLHAKDICNLEEFKATVEAVNSIIVYFSYNIGAGGLATLRLHQRSLYGKEKALSAKGTTRWSSQIKAAVALIESKDALLKTVNGPDWARGKDNATAVRKLVIDGEQTFWESCELLIRVLDPIRLSLLVLQGDSATLADVYAQWIAIHRAHAGIERAAFEVETTSKALLDILEKRMDFLLHPAHIVSYAFHPHFAQSSSIEIALVRELAHLLANDLSLRSATTLPDDFEAKFDKELDTFFGVFSCDKAYKAAWSNTHIQPVSSCVAHARRQPCFEL